MLGQSPLRATGPGGAAGSGAEYLPLAMFSLRPTRWRFLLFLATLIVGTAAAFILHHRAPFLIGFDLAAIAYILANLWLLRTGSPDLLRKVAAEEEAGRAGTLALGAVMVAASVAAVLQEAPSSRGEQGGVVLALITLVLAWVFASLMMAAHYAHRYYDPRGGGEGGLDFPGDAHPDYADFCYFAFVLSATFQVSDVSINERGMRQIATLHGIAAFFFNIGAVALTVGLAADAFKGG